MKLSTRGRYGARMMLDLAIHSTGNPVFLKDIAKRQGISEKYLGQLIPSLKKSGLINSTRGAHGGYSLTRTAKDITLFEIVQACEGDLNIVECVNTPGVCRRADLCVTRDAWNKLRDTVRRALESITLDNMVSDYNKKKVKQPVAYSI